MSANTTACLIIHNREVQYNPLTMLCAKSPKCILWYAIKYMIHEIDRSLEKSFVPTFVDL